jgi:hypothetical protein
MRRAQEKHMRRAQGETAPLVTNKNRRNICAELSCSLTDIQQLWVHRDACCAHSESQQRRAKSVQWTRMGIAPQDEAAASDVCSKQYWKLRRVQGWWTLVYDMRRLL